MDARDVCRRLNCSPIILSDWVDKGCPVTHHQAPYAPFAEFDVELVKRWLAESNIVDWPKESDHDTDWPIRLILKALEAKEITPWQAEKVILNLGSGVWG